jgi:hypothetical protein
MTQEWDCSEARVALGVYVLGAIDPAERAQVDAHLATCEACRAELAELADLPALLALVPAEEAIALADGLPGDHLFLADDMLLGPLPVIRLPAGAADDGEPEGAVGTWGINGATGGAIAADAASVTGDPAATSYPTTSYPAAPSYPGATGTADVAQETTATGAGHVAGAAWAGGAPQALAPVIDLAARRRQRLARAGTVAAAAVIIGAASFGGVKLAASPAPNSSQVTSADPQHPNGSPITGWLTAQGGNGPAVATVSYRSMGWGIQLAAKVKGVPLNTPCTMWVVKLNGSRAYAGSWITDTDEGAVWYPGSASTAASDVKAFVITISEGQEITVTPA